MKTAYFIALGLSGLLATGSLQAAKVFTWVDENGVTHFSERPPKNVKAAAVQVNTGHSEPVNYETPTEEVSPTPAAPEPTTTATQPQASKASPERCEQARKNLEVLKNFGRVRVQNEDGSFSYLTEEDQNERLNENQKIIDESC